MSLAARLGSLNTVQVLKRAADTLFSKHLLVTNTTITVSLSMTGDILQQKYEIMRQRQKIWDPSRTLKVSGTAVFIGPACHYWYIFLDRILPGTAVRTIAKKILIDQVVFSPINISMFVFLLGWFERSSLKEIIHELKIDGPQLLKAEWIVWPPAQVVNFYFLPTKYRVLFDNTVSLGFDYYYSYVKFRKDKPKLDDAKDDCDIKPLIAKDYHTHSEKYIFDKVQEEKIICHIEHCNRAFRVS